MKTAKKIKRLDFISCFLFFLLQDFAFKIICFRNFNLISLEESCTSKALAVEVCLMAKNFPNSKDFCVDEVKLLDSIYIVWVILHSSQICSLSNYK